MAADARDTGGWEPAQPGLLRELNERAVLDTIHRLPGISRAEAARQTGLSKPTVSLALRTLEESGLVRPARSGPDREARPGRARVLYEAVADAALAAAVEITVSGVRGLVVDLDGTPVSRATATWRSTRSAETVYGAVARCVARLADALPDGRTPDCVVLGTPGVIDPTTGVLTQAGILPVLDATLPVEELQRRLGLPIEVRNDVDLAALGEQAEGPGRDVADFAVLWVGTGIGAALVLDGRLHRGHRGGAGEVADVPFARVAGPGPGVAPEFVTLGATVEGVEALAARLHADGHPTGLTAPLTARSVLDAALVGDPLGTVVAGELATWAAWYVTVLSAVVDPELVVLSGPLGSHDALLAPVQRQLADLLHAPPQLAISKLGDDSVLIGAAATARSTAADLVFGRRLRGRTNETATNETATNETATNEGAT